MKRPEPPLHILVLAYDYPPAHDSGMGTHIYELARGLGQAGWRSTVLVPQREDRDLSPEALAAWEADNVAVHRMQPSAATRALARAPDQNPAALLMSGNMDMEALATRLAQEGPAPDLIHCHDFFFVPAGLRLKQTLGVPLVASVHLLFEPLHRWWGQAVLPGIFEVERAMCRGADALITVSRSMAEIMTSTHELPADSVHVVHNGFDMDSFAAQGAAGDALPALRRRYQLGNDDQVVLYAGRIARQKGLRELIQSAALVLAERPGVIYLLAGPTPPPESEYEAELLRMCEDDERLRARVRFVGKLSRVELAHLYRIADVAVVPSIYEPFGYAATEAMAAGVPLVATRAGGLAEIVEHGRSGLLVPADALADGVHTVDVEALAAAQLALLRDPALARQLGQRAQERVREDFTLESMLAATVRVYHAVHGAARRGHDAGATGEGAVS